jgi:hypothetical protein
VDIVDCHVHLYPAEAARDPAGWAAARGEGAWAAAVAPSGRRSIQGWSDPDALIAHMDEAGVAACVLVGWYWERQETCEEQNGWHAGWVRRHPGRLFAFAAAQPSAGARAVEAAEAALDGGLSGIGELLAGEAGPLSAGYRSLLELAARRSVPVLFHATDPEAGPRAGPPTPLGDFVRAAAEYPAVPVILAHWGGGMAFRGAPGGAPLPRNLYFDAAASPLLYGPWVHAQACARAGADRILFGSDYPLMLYPKVSREPRLKPFVDEVLGAGVAPADAAAILGGNMRSLLRGGLAPGTAGV